jgi:hypothetical protein
MIGLANIYKQSRYDFSTLTSNTIDLKPPGDLPGLYWGAFRVSLSGSGDYSKPQDNPNNYANSYLFTVEVNGVVVFRHRHVNRNWWRPRQLYQNGVWNGSIFTNFNWAETSSNDSTANPSGGLIGAFTGLSNGAPLRSYQDAFFEPQAQGPAATPLAFTVGTVPTKPTRHYWCNCEPVFFNATVLPGQSFVLRSRRFREVPNSTLSPPISDAAPQSGQAAEPDEVESQQSDGTWGNTPQNIEGWVIRVGPDVETLQQIATIAPNPGEIDL